MPYEVPLGYKYEPQIVSFIFHLELRKGVNFRVFAIYQIRLGWKTCKYSYETDEFRQPKANLNPRKIRLKVAFGPLYPTAKKKKKKTWVGIDFYIGNRLRETEPSQFFRKHRITGKHNNKDQI